MKPPDQEMFRIGLAAKKLGLHVQTLRRWLHAGKIAGVQMGREVRIPRSEVERLLGEQGSGIVVLYARVSGPGQKGDLTVQLQTLTEWAKQEHPTARMVHYSDVGSGLRTDRAGLYKLIRQVQDHEVKEVVVTYADRLTRFGFEYLQLWFQGYGTRITVLNLDEIKSPEQELTDELLTCAQQVLHSP
jgi:putative resolvase